MAVTYRSVVAAPDNATFVTCMARHAAREDREQPHLADGRRAVLAAWASAVRAHNVQEASGPAAVTDGVAAGQQPLDLQEKNEQFRDTYPRTRHCVRLQRLRFGHDSRCVWEGMENVISSARELAGRVRGAGLR